MIFSWFKRRRRRNILSQTVPDSWEHTLRKGLEHFKRLDDEKKQQLIAIVQVLVAEKDWVGCGGLDLTEDKIVLIAGQAGTLLLGIEHDYYRNIDSILVYPTGYTIDFSAHGPYVGTEKRAVLGHAQMRGPVVLSWRHAYSGGRDADDGRNLVYHEFAHKLDMLDGAVDGTPILPNKRALSRWIKVMTRAYGALRRDAKKGKRSLIDHYGATDVGEFFACATEAFFERGKRMKQKEPELYDVLYTFYRQDTASWRRR